ncbi:REP-associated tyrosine transposase [Halomonas koreensis]|uniref:Transposase n=1 Tax=Halomonas koreensis TaxID=245385 RepID=A0ABU1FZ58_9GAMM|nr:transposase [Halomonas koreensis]MDR5865960.1 transposase [Halomonas koreensis]
MDAPHARDLRKGRHSLAWRCYHITLVTEARRPVFADVAHARAACRLLYASPVSRHGRTLCHVVMPDHVHWLVELEDRLPVLVRLYKAKVSQAVGECIWQRGYHDHALREDEGLKDTARYIVANPLRAGLVDDILQYPYWNAIWL